MRRQENEATQTDHQVLLFEVSDADLERAAGTDIATAFTLGNCTGLESCPA